MLLNCVVCAGISLCCCELQVSAECCCLNSRYGTGSYHQPDVTFRYHPDVAFLGCRYISLMLLLFYAGISLMLL
jgi:hypothetical protein